MADQWTVVSQAPDTTPPPSPLPSGLPAVANSSASPASGWTVKSQDPDPSQMSFVDRLLNKFSPLTPEQAAKVRKVDNAFTPAGAPQSDFAVHAANMGLGAAHAVGNMIAHPIDTAKSIAKTGYDLLGETMPIVGGMSVSPSGQFARSSQQQQSQQAIQQQGQQIVQGFKDNPAYAIGEQAGPILVGEDLGEVGGVAAKGAGKLAKDIGVDIPKDVTEAAAKALTRTDTPATRTMVREAAQANDAAELKAQAETQKIKEAHQAKVAEISAKNQAAREAAVGQAEFDQREAVKKVQEANQSAAEAHAAKAEQITADNQAEQERVEAANQAARDAAQAKYQQDAEDATSLDKNRSDLSKQYLQQQDRVARRVQDLAARTKSSLNDRFNVVRAAVGDDSASLGDLQAAVEKAKQMFAGSDEKVREFQDILGRAKDDSAEEAMKDMLADKAYGKQYGDLEPVKQQAIDNHVAQVKQEGGGELEDESGISFDHLRGYSNELYQAAKSARDGDVRRAIGMVRAKVDAMAQGLADDNGVGSKLKSARRDWATYKDVFEEAAGPSGSGSPVAKSLNAEDAANAVAPFMSDDPAIAGRARQLLVGNKFKGPYFDEGAGKLVDQLRNIAKQQAGLPKKTPTPEMDEPKLQIAKQTELPAAPQPKPEPILSVDLPNQTPVPPEPQPVEPNLHKLSPDEIKRQKQGNIYHAIEKMRTITGYRLGGLLLGGSSLIGGLAKAFTSGDLRYVAGGSAAAGAAIALAFGPRLIASLLEKPEIIDKLSNPTMADFHEVMKLPPEQRPEVEAAMRVLIEQGQKAGKLKQDNAWLRGFKTFLKSSGPATMQQPPEQSANEEVRP